MTAAPSAPTTAFIDLLDARYSCRGYRSDPVPLATVRSILQASQRSPSWANTQPWGITVLGGEETGRFRDHLVAAVLSGKGASDIPAPERYEGEYLARRRAAGFALYDSLGIARDDRAARDRQMLENFRFFGAPHVAVVTGEASIGPYGYVDVGAYVATFLLAATAHGVASIAQAAIGMYSTVVREYLEIPDTRHVVCGISFGYADEDHPANGWRTDRASIDDLAVLRGF